MKVYISVLRGINVGGKRIILMADLKSLYQKLGFFNITTYIQSGNVIFYSNKTEDCKKLATLINQEIETTFGFNVTVIVRSVNEMKEIITNNPFLTSFDGNIERLYLTFLGERPSIENIDKIKGFNFHPDYFEIIDNNVFILCSGRYSDSKLTNNYFENKLKVTATTRNWKTIIKLYELAKQNP